MKPMIEQALSGLEDVDVQVYEPSSRAAEVLARQSRHSEVRLIPARAMLLYAMFCYEAHDEHCSLFVANKLSYFYQMLGEYVHNRLTAQQIEHIRQLLRLIDGYESAYALEVLASVAYVRSQEPGISLDDSIRRIESWSQRKKDLFKREHIQAAYQHLDTWMN